jgi:uncharacterized protein YjbI with pentapeptide repeats
MRAALKSAVLAITMLGATIALVAPGSPAAAATLIPTVTYFSPTLSPYAGDSSTLVATVSVRPEPGSPPTERVPSGTVMFRRGTKSLGSVPVVDGLASLNTRLPVGTADLSATFVTSSTHAGSVSYPLEWTVAKGTTTTSLTVDQPGTTPGDEATLTATVEGPDAFHPVSGTVTFKRNGSAIGTAGIAGGQATLTKALSAGSLPVTASYNGSTSLAPSTSAPTTVTVAKAATSTTIVAIDGGLAGSSNRFIANVTVPGLDRTATGTVTFRRGTSSLGTVPLDETGAAELHAPLPAGTASLTATYNGSTSLASSVSPAVPFVVSKVRTATHLVVTTGAEAPSGAPVTLVATVIPFNGATPTGTVTFRRGTVAVGGPVALDPDGNATLTTTTLPVGTHSLTATYNGSSTLNASASKPSTLAVYRPATTTLLELDDNTVVAGQPVAMTATVQVTDDAARIPTGSVTFRRNGYVLQTVPVDGSGVATITRDDIAAGAATITATYSGSSKLLPSDSVSQVLLADKAETMVAIAPFAPPATGGESVTLVAQVAAVAPSVGTPTGQVTFRSGGASLGRVSLSGGIATLTTTALPAGPSTISASYAGSGSYLPSDQTASNALVAPSEVTAEAGRGSALVSFTPPTTDGGSPITSFTATALDQTDTEAEPVTASGPWTPIDVADLTPGHSYTFTVTVENEAGDTATSDPSNAVVPLDACPAVDDSIRTAAAPGVDWHGCDLANADLSGLDLTGADLSGASLSQANLTGLDLGEADLTDANLSGADLGGADLSAADLTGATLTAVRSGGVTGSSAALPSNWQVTRGYLIGPGAWLQDAQLAGVDLTGVLLGSADLRGADLSGATLRSITAGFANLSGADLSEADLHGATLIVSNVQGARLVGTDLTAAQLGASNFRDVDLTDADLTGAVTAAPPQFGTFSLAGATLCRTTMFDGTVDSTGCPA